MVCLCEKSVVEEEAIPVHAATVTSRDLSSTAVRERCCALSLRQIHFLSTVNSLYVKLLPLLLFVSPPTCKLNTRLYYLKEICGNIYTLNELAPLSRLQICLNKGKINCTASQIFIFFSFSTFKGAHLSSSDLSAPRLDVSLT